MGYQPDYHTEGIIYAKHLLGNVKDAKIGVLYQNDDYGKDYFNGLKDGLGNDAGRIIKAVTYEVTDPTVDSQVIELKNSGANVFYNVSIPKFAAQAMRKAAELQWKPVQYMNNVSASVTATMKPAGFDNVQGVLTAAWLKDPTDHQWDNDADMKEWRAFMAKHMPDGNVGDGNYVYAYSACTLMRETLKKCGDNLTRENVMKQAASHKQLRLPGMLPGISVSTSASDFYPVQAVQLSRFKGETWELFGDVMHNEST
jgi:branched-chain amino acid transport system substrate-binding protein